MALNKKDDLFMIQVRLFRLAQIRWNMNTTECERMYDDYKVNDYIATCYEEYHVRGDGANIDNIEKYLSGKGVKL